MLMLLLEKHLMLSRSDGRGGTINYYYYDEITWVVAAVAVVWIAWMLIRRYRRLRAQRRPRRGVKHRVPRRVVKIKNELSSNYLAVGPSNNLHAMGIGLDAAGDYCIQFFVSDATQELWPGAGTATIPASHNRVSLALVQLPRASFWAGAATDLRVDPGQGQNSLPIRQYLEVTVGGVSGANMNLTGQNGTLGFFCRSRGKNSYQDVCVLSNAHVLVDLQNPVVSDSDLIVQPGPGERSPNESIGTLTDFAPLKFDNGDKPNFIDAAIATLKPSQKYQAVLPAIGAVKGYASQDDVAVGETVRKFGRSTGYTEGRIYSIELDVWIDYDRTRQSAFFKNQFLIEPASPTYPIFVSKGDSGSMVMGEGNYAVGLLCGGGSQDLSAIQPPGNANVPIIKNYGIANPISKVLDNFGMELVIGEQ